MLRIVQVGNSLPFSWPVDPACTFQPGQIAQLYTINNNIVAGVSDGLCPIGIIDDIKTTAFTAPQIDEVVMSAAPGVDTGNGLVTPIDIKVELANPNVTLSSFISKNLNVVLIPRNGVVVFPAGTPLNFDLDGDGIPDAVRTVVSYTYQVPNIPGDDSTQASGRVTVWFQRGIFQSDQYETNCNYPVGASLFVSESGLLTTRQPTPDHPGMALVSGPPTSIFGTLEFIWF